MHHHHSPKKGERPLVKRVGLKSGLSEKGREEPVAVLFIAVSEIAIKKNLKRPPASPMTMTSCIIAELISKTSLPRPETKKRNNKPENALSRASCKSGKSGS